MAVQHHTPQGETHAVFNQAPPLADYNAFHLDQPLREAVSREGAAWAERELGTYGALTGSAETIALGYQANENKPKLRTHDRYGHRIDEAEFHPAWHACMKLSVENELHAQPWNRPQPGAHVARCAKNYLMTQVEAGHLCPITMTFAVVPALRVQPEIAAEWVPRVTATQYDPRMRPAPEKAGCIMGMAMTEKQGGSDVRANTTQAEAIGAGGPGGEYLLTGHKWFCSAPMSDAFLTLAQTDAGLSCFLVPRWLPDGTRNVFRIQRLKDKLGNHSNASSEIEYAGTWARMVGGEGRGVPTIIEMVNHTRLDCAVGSAALMRHAVLQATHHATHRAAFGKLLREQPLMRNVLADLALESEAALVLALRLARAYDESEADAAAGAFRRIATAVGKYWICKRAPAMVYEAMECHGGAGYVEEGILPRLYREAPLASIWEGSGNVMCLDVLRAMAREPETLPAFQRELAKAAGADARYDAFVRSLEQELARPEEHEARARRIVEQMALALQGALLLQHAPHAVADAFVASRLAGAAGQEYGTLPAGTDFGAIIGRVLPTD
jgi:putative acyl-CoA dehydrogenase